MTMPQTSPHTPKFSIVTPVLNGEQYIAETITSILSQKGDFEIEYIIVDGASTDGTAAAASRFMKLLEDGRYPIACKGVSMSFLSGKDGSMYDAVNRGLARATGDIFAWINADDIYAPGAFSAIVRVFDLFPQARWVKGITSYIDESSRVTRPGRCLLYNQQWLKDGVYGRELYFVQQDSCFWKADLWKEAGGIPERWKFAGDYCLWTRFADRAPLFSMNVPVSCFRQTRGQLSEDRKSYRREVDELFPRGRNRHKRLSLYLAWEPRIPACLRKHLLRALFGKQPYFLVMPDARSEFVLETGTYHELSRLLESKLGVPSYRSLEIS